VGIPEGHQIVQTFEVRGLGQVVLLRHGPSHYYTYNGKQTPYFYEPVREDGQALHWPRFVEGHVVAKVVETFNDKGGYPRYAFIVDEVTGPVFDKLLYGHTPNYKEGHEYYLVEIDGKPHLILDGKVVGPYDYLSVPKLIDGHVDYSYTLNGKEYFSADGETIGPFDELDGGMERSGGGFSYVYREGDSWHVMRNGVVSSPYLEFGGSHMVAGHFWYTARTLKGWHYVIEGVQGPAVQEPGIFNEPKFTPEGEFCYWANEAESGKQIVVTNKQTYYLIGDLAEFGFYGGHVAWVVFGKDRDQLFVDGQEKAVEETFVPKTLWVEEKNGQLHYGGKIRRVYQG
jgi:hypothetical protein